jgi:hypothetical protein
MTEATTDALKAQYESYTAEVERLQVDLAEFAKMRRTALLDSVEARRSGGERVHYSDYGLSRQVFSAMLKKARKESTGG